MKRIIKYLLITTLMGGFIFLMSCSEDFLDKEPPGSAAGAVMQSVDGVEALLIGAYDRTTCRSMFGGAMGMDWTYGECASDNAYKGTSYGDQASFNTVERWEVLPDNGYMANRWSEGYNGVARANEVLTYLFATQEGDNPIPEPRATQIEAEAKFLRAYFHFKLNRIFRNIAYIKTVSEMDMQPGEVPNDGPNWDNIEADLQFAIDNLSATPPLGHVGRPTRYAAMAMKGHAHMYQNEHAQAKPLFNEIITNGGYELVANFQDNYDAHFNNNEESIWEIQISVSGESTGNTMRCQRALAHQSGAVGIGWGFYQPSHDLFEAYQTVGGLPVLDKEDRTPLVHDQGIGSDEEFIPTDHPLDPRVDWTIARRGIDFQGWAIHEGMSWIREQPNGGPYMTKKYHHQAHEVGFARSAGDSRNARNIRTYRLAHVLLWMAEIAVEENDLDRARQLVNQVRERAKGSDPVMGLCTTYAFDGSGDYTVDYDQPAANYVVEPYPVGHAAFASQEEARKAVRLEIRLETATEGHRFFDLRRWGIISDVLNDFVTKDLEIRDFMSGAVFNSPRDEYWPLPQAQLDIQDVLSQDPNY